MFNKGLLIAIALNVDVCARVAILNVTADPLKSVMLVVTPMDKCNVSDVV